MKQRKTQIKYYQLMKALKAVTSKKNKLNTDCKDQKLLISTLITNGICKHKELLNH